MDDKNIFLVKKYYRNFDKFEDDFFVYNDFTKANNKMNFIISKIKKYIKENSNDKSFNFFYNKDYWLAEDVETGLIKWEVQILKLTIK